MQSNLNKIKESQNAVVRQDWRRERKRERERKLNKIQDFIERGKAYKENSEHS